MTQRIQLGTMEIIPSQGLAGPRRVAKILSTYEALAIKKPVKREQLDCHLALPPGRDATVCEQPTQRIEVGFVELKKAGVTGLNYVSLHAFNYTHRVSFDDPALQ
ncbi:FAD dependent oxidoreductase [Penicillium sp. IBT 18751x]|nr:FAD dependent oxidoreductase [Penicillium sp. IBT 18751x]